MVFGWQRSQKSVKNSAKSPRALPASLTRHSIDHSSSTPTSTGAPRRTSIPVPDTIAEDGCEVVPQFFPGIPAPASSTVLPANAQQLSINTSSIESQYLSTRAKTMSQRRAGSIRVASAGVSVAGEELRDLHGPQSAPAYQSAHVPRRSSNGSSISSSSTINCMQTHRTSSSSSSQQHRVNTPSVKNSASGTSQHGHRLSPTALSSSATALDNKSHRRASAINFSLGDNIVSSVNNNNNTNNTPSGGVAFAIPATLIGEGCPGSYAQRRRGSIQGARTSIDANSFSSSGSSTAGSSTVASPVLPHYMPSDRFLGAAHHQYYRQSQYRYYNPLSQLKRNHTTKTVTHNDLLIGTDTVMEGAMGSEVHNRRLTPSHSTSFTAYKRASQRAMSTNSALRHGHGHMYYSQTASGRISQLLDEDETEATTIQNLSPEESVPVVAHGTGISKIDLDDDSDIASKIVPSVDTVGTQVAYLPPRSAKLSITN
ncbi:hypothetical protein BX070DRAFT_234570 [Coemansia spiralis]|nr:hypothetical protein BX070DRAFT_234570 [Coemansia spiralis]